MDNGLKNGGRSLALNCPESDYLEWRIFNQKELLEEQKNNPDFKNWVRFSPLDVPFHSFYKKVDI